MNAVETSLARQFMYEHQDYLLVKLYGKYGKRVAPYVQKSRFLQYGFKLIFDPIVNYQSHKMKKSLIGGIYAE